MSAPETPADKLRRIASDTEFVDILDWQIASRFVQEVHRIEQEGRSKSRGWLEQKLRMAQGAISRVARGIRLPHVAHYALLKREVNGDLWFILTGARDEELSSWLRAGKSLIVREGGYKPRDLGMDAYANWRANQQQKAPSGEMLDGAGS